jgi:hypothetical protein
LSAEAVLNAQFNGILTSASLAIVSEQLAGDWEWIKPADEAPAQTVDINERLDVLEDLIRQLIPGHGMIGHNHPPASSALDSADQAEALTAIAQTRTGLAAGEQGIQEVEIGAARLP